MNIEKLEKMASLSEKKAAETAAVGQPQYPTGGYAPKMGPSIGGVPIPVMTYDGRVYSDRNSGAYSISDPIEIRKPSDWVPTEKALRIANPRHGAWFAAHTNALTKATKPLRDAGVEGSDDIPKALSDAISKLYHDEMMRTTNAPAAKAVAPSKKPAEKKAAFDVDWSKIKGNVNWDAIKQKLTEAKQWYEGQNPETRALIGAGVGLGGGALLGKLMGRTGTGAVAGALAGAGAGAYWKELKKVIEATKPIASDAAKKTKDRVSQLMQKVRPKSTQGEKAPSGERDAIEKAVSASIGGYADRFMKDWERTQAEGLPPQGVNLVVR